MRIVLYLSKNTDLDLYAYFRDLEYRKSTHAKQLLKDYIHRQHTVHIAPPRVTADVWSDTSLPKLLTIPVRFGLEDKDLIDYFSDIPTGLRAKCMKSMLRTLLSPYTQCAFHRDPVEVYIPYENGGMVLPVAKEPEVPNSTQALTCTIQSMQLLMMQMMSSMQPQAMPQNPQPAPAPKQEKVEEIPPKPEFLNHRPDWGSGMIRENRKNEAPQGIGFPDAISHPVVPGDIPHETKIPAEVLTPAYTSESEDDSGGVEGSNDDAIMKLFGVDF